jgi:cobalt/nickel transport protein
LYASTNYEIGTRIYFLAQEEMIMKMRIALITNALVLFLATTAFAHFGMLIPDSDELTQDNRTVNLTLSFSHPFERAGMELEKPAEFFVVTDNKEKTNLLDTLKKTKVMGHTAWKTSFTPRQPGLYAFVFDPVPYKEDAENNYTRHITKVIIDAYGEGEDWNKPLGLKTEIIPLTRPFGNYAGNVFQGIIMLDGKPAPYTRVEVEYYNKDGKRNAPNERMITQEVLADGNGVFTFACPWKGWWGFAGLNADSKQYKGRELELGAVLWIEMK